MDLITALNMCAEVCGYRADMWQKIADNDPEGLVNELNCFMESDAKEGANMEGLTREASKVVYQHIKDLEAHP